MPSPPHNHLSLRETKWGWTMTMQEAIETSISAAISAGTVDPEAHAAALQALRQLAERADNNDPERDNVTYPTMLRYLSALGMVPVQEAAGRQATPKPASSLAKARASSKFSKFHVA